MKIIQMNKGYEALVDDDLYDELSQYHWSYANGYAQTSHPSLKYTGLMMHRLIMNVPEGMEVDHIDHNRLNNQRSNLRVCTPSQNRMNSKARNPTGYKGVQKAPTNKYDRWIASITSNGRTIYLGRYLTPEEAARAYDAKAKELHGQFAYLNFADS